ncbi:MAG: competence protein CoiA [Muribaculaceae bacterium]|nr:competence protein CoiA [Muribaculaceae bacterium]
MEKDYRREQHYAVSSKGVLAHIIEAHSNHDDYYCPHCGCRMIKRCGNIRAWHFAHDWRYANETQKNCSYETYLHGYAKLRLKQWFDESKSIILHYQRSIRCKHHESCALIHDKCSRDINKSCDLKTLFDTCSVESTVKESNGNYRADLLLSTEADPSRHILIEIKVSHGCTDKKKTSDAQIIEFDVSSEEDIEYIISHDIEPSEKVRYYGFKNLIRIDDEGVIKPTLFLRKFILYKSGKTFCKKIDCQSITDHHSSSLFELTADIPEEYNWYLNLYGLITAAERGLQFPNCYLCEHYCYNEDDGCYECDIKKAVVEKGADALTCDSYVLRDNAADILNNNVPPFKIIDIWFK